MIRRTRFRMCLCIICLLLIITFIWGNSLLPGTDSGALSNSVNELLQKLFPFLFSNNSSTGDSWVRKLAHFSEFTLLGICLCWIFAMLYSRLCEQIPRVLFFGILVACADETIQRFIPGRNGNLIDVGIDSSGIAVGTLMFTIGYLIFINTKQHNLEEL